MSSDALFKRSFKLAVYHHNRVENTPKVRVVILIGHDLVGNREEGRVLNSSTRIQNHLYRELIPRHSLKRDISTDQSRAIVERTLHCICIRCVLRQHPGRGFNFSKEYSIWTVRSGPSSVGSHIRVDSRLTTGSISSQNVTDSLDVRICLELSDTTLIVEVRLRAPSSRATVRIDNHVERKRWISRDTKLYSSITGPY